MSVNLFTYKTNGINVIKAVKAAAKYADVEVVATEVAAKDVSSASTKAKTPFGKFPYMTASGVVLYDGAAMLKYIGSIRKDLNLSGANIAEEAIVEQWMTLTLKEFSAKIASLEGGAYGDKVAKIKDIVDYFTIVDAHFIHHTYIAGNTFTVADILLATTLLGPYTSFFATTVQEMLPNLTRFFMTVVNQPIVASVVGKVELATKDLYMELAKAFIPPTADKPAEKPKKEVNSLDTLPKSTMKIDDVKREWSLQRPFNPNFGEWFWQNFDAEGWALWEVSYKYPEDWDKDYAADNQLVGFINRCECVKKYGFAVLNMFKANEEHYHAKGAFVLRGTEIPSLMEDVSDFEEYNFTKIDSTTAEGKAKFISLICAETIDNKEIIFRRALK